jgi:hypothetical protein
VKIIAEALQMTMNVGTSLDITPEPSEDRDPYTAAIGVRASAIRGDTSSNPFCHVNQRSGTQSLRMPRH